jgi:Leucine-rich repeat (LRR) protein/GTPase SAR1 family protein
MYPEELLRIIEKAAREKATELNLSGKYLSQLPPEIGQLANIQKLDLSRNKLKQLPLEICQIFSLRDLNLSFNKLSQLSFEFSYLANIQKFDLSGNQLSQLSLEFAKLSHLTYLDLSYNQLNQLLPEIGQLSHLTELYLSGNQLRQLPPEIGQLSHLTELYLSGNQLRQLPPEIGQLSHLTELYLSGNQLKQLPPEIDQLSHLTELYLDDNQLEQLPFRIGQLTNLKKLYIRGNKLKKLPLEFAQLISLETLYLSRNPLEDPPPEIVARGIEAIREYFRQKQEAGEDKLYEAKLLIVGEAGAGKTTLAKKIENPDYPVPTDEDSTKGIEVIQWSFPMDNGQDFRVNIWDFGGQEIYHATHQFFLTKRSLYVLVADTRKEDTDFYYWLNVVQLLSENSPLLIVKNEKQDRHRDINERQLRGMFENLKETLPTNLATKRGLPEILREIKHYISSLPHVGSVLPKTWIRVREALESDLHNYISLEEYLDICQQKGFTRRDDKLQLSSYLHDLGVILHFQDDPILNNTVILKPKWGTDAVYRVLDDLQIIRNLGRFTWSDLQNIWSEGGYINKQGELLQLMMKFELCYEIPGNPKTYIAPQLLTENQPKYDWDEADNLILRYTYEFMPKGILTRFIVAIHRYINRQHYVWRSGVILSKDETKAEVIEYYGKREIKIRVAGKFKKDLMIVVTHELDKIHDSYKGQLKYHKLVPCNCEEGYNFCKGSQDPHFYDFRILRKFEIDKQLHIQCLKSYSDVPVKNLIEGVTITDDRRPSLMRSPNKIFISYSHQDKAYLQQLQVYLKALKKKLPINPWADTEIKPGMKWRTEIQNALDEAEIAILLISSNFLASDFIDEVELPQLLKAAESGGTLILPLILDSCDAILSHSELEQFQAVNPLSKPLDSMTEYERKAIFNSLVKQISDRIK